MVAPEDSVYGFHATPQAQDATQARTALLYQSMCFPAISKQTDFPSKRVLKPRFNTYRVYGCLLANPMEFWPTTQNSVSFEFNKLIIYLLLDMRSALLWPIRHCLANNVMPVIMLAEVKAAIIP